MTYPVFRFVGPDRIKERAETQSGGVHISCLSDLERWVRDYNEPINRGEVTVATFVIDTDLKLLLADRHSEHIACNHARDDCLAAGEIWIDRSDSNLLEFAEVSNQSSGYCPDVTCWAAFKTALNKTGIEYPAQLTHPIIWRRCPNGHINLVKDDYFVCLECDQDISNDYNFEVKMLDQ